MSTVVDELNGANQKIVDSISTISAISQEVSANAKDTLVVKTISMLWITSLKK